MSRTERARCPECGYSVVLEVESPSGDWKARLTCDECDVVLDVGLFAYGSEP